MVLKEVARYNLPYKGMKLVIARGSVLDFKGDAIVNAANVGCLGGGGVDGAISAAGGANLVKDRESLPVLENQNGIQIRCREGEAVLTGPNDYGSLPSSIIHAVGPNFNSLLDLSEGKQLLKTAYSSTLDIAYENSLKIIGFSLLSAGIFRGPLELEEVLELGVTSIYEWSSKRAKEEQLVTPVEEIHLCAFTSPECQALLEACGKKL